MKVWIVSLFAQLHSLPSSSFYRGWLLQTKFPALPCILASSSAQPVGGTSLRKSKLLKMEQRLPLLRFFLRQICIVHCAPGSVRGCFGHNEQNYQSLCPHRPLGSQRTYSFSNTHAFVPSHFLFCLPRMPFPPLIISLILFTVRHPAQIVLPLRRFPWLQTPNRMIPSLHYFIFVFIIYSIFMINMQELYNQRKIYSSLFLKEQIWMIPVWCLNFKLDRFFVFFKSHFPLLNFR